MNYADWFAEAHQIVAGRCGLSVLEMDAYRCWVTHYKDGFTPEEAVYCFEGINASS